MNKKIGFILALVLVSLMMVGSVSAGLFDFLGGNNANQTANDENTFIVGSMQSSHHTDTKMIMEATLVSI